MCARRREEEIALVAGQVAGAVQFGAVGAGYSPGVMPGGQRGGAEFARGREQIAKLDALVAADARNWGLAAAIGVGEILDDLGAEASLVIKDVMRDAQAVGGARGIFDIPSGAAGAFASDLGAVVVELQGDADDFEAALDQDRCRHR